MIKKDSYHVVKKKIKYYDKNLKETVIPLDYNAYTLQLFNYDAFTLAQPEKFGLIEIRRQDEFSSIKNPPGSSENNTATARRALSLLHQRWFEEKGVRFDSKKSFLKLTYFVKKKQKEHLILCLK